MTKEEKQKAINALKISAPVRVMTWEKFGYYIQTINQVMNWLEQESTTENGIDRAELLKAMDTWDKFGNDPNEGLIPLRTPALQDRYVPYVNYDDMVNCVKGMPSVTPIRPKGYWREADTNMYACSKCSHVLTIDPLDNSISEMNYCPFCSADMREVEE